MIELTANAEGSFNVNQWCAPPTVYLDHWAWRKISESDVLAEKFSRVLTKCNGTLAFSWLNRQLQTGKNRRHHAMDVSHAIVAVAYCEYVLLDNHWATQVEQARKRIRDGGGSFPMAKVFSDKENGLETFLQELESAATCQPIESK